MSCVSIAAALLTANSALTNVVPATRIVCGVLPESTALPAIGVMEIGTTEIPRIDATAPTTLVDGHAQITIVASTYKELKQIHRLARKACNYFHGTVATFTVVSVRRIANGPDLSDIGAKFYMQSLDVSVIYYEPN